MAPAWSLPVASASGLPSSGIKVGNGSRCFSSSRVTPTCRSSALSMKISGLPSPFQSATARSLTPARVGKVFGAASEPSGCWKQMEIWPLSGSATSKSGKPSPLTSAHKQAAPGLVGAG